MPDTGTPPPTRYISWEQLCQETDPGFFQALARPWVYEFSNGRIFQFPATNPFVLGTSELGGGEVL